MADGGTMQGGDGLGWGIFVDEVGIFVDEVGIFVDGVDECTM